ncbi:2'-5' RNA ligase family protein [Natronomonas halophila]|uniref:2'-5' RNA ligase family protein n=1 Tax=Natronomonas halophila TaxID=2747817 RepID=UPI0015B5D863|nr:2'-5' RNA ligase family protein [Natronomonas halophila]QLD86354.1 2'-5' RNA ligase family protein [Natronomonas halophila]
MADDGLASNPATFWNRRHELSLAPITDEDVRQRAGGRGRHLVLLARITDDTVRSRVEPILKRLDGFDCFAAQPTRNLHITVKVLGNVVENPQDEAEFAPEEEAELVAKLDDALEEATSFAVDIPRLNLFPDVVYAEVADDGRFAALNHRVCSIAGVPVRERDRTGFIPHLTLGHFTRRDGYERLLQYLERNRSLDLPPRPVSELELVALDFSDGRFPPYETVRTYDLSEP